MNAVTVYSLSYTLMLIHSKGENRMMFLEPPISKEAWT